MSADRTRTVLLFPAWLVIWVLRPALPHDHMLKRVGLRAFARNATDVAELYSLFFWIASLNLCAFAAERCIR